MGIEKILMSQPKALPPASQFNWSQMESSCTKTCNTRENRRTGMLWIELEESAEKSTPRSEYQKPKPEPPGQFGIWIAGLLEVGQATLRRCECRLIQLRIRGADHIQSHR